MAQGAIQSQMKIQSHMKRSDSDPGVYSKFESKTSPQDSGADSILRRCFRSLYLTLFPANLIVDRLQRRQATLSPSGEKAEMMEGRCWILRSRLAWYRQIFAAFLQGLQGFEAEPVSNGTNAMATKFVRESSTRSAGTSLYCTVVWI